MDSMSQANIKIRTQQIQELKKITGENTGQKAVEKALLYYLKDAKQRRIIDVLDQVEFVEGFDPLVNRRNEKR